MKLRLKFNFFLLMILFALSATASVVAADEKQLIVGWGDSLTEGFCTHGYNEVLLDQMADVGRPSTQVNCGIGGEKSMDSLQRLRQTLQCGPLTMSRGYCSDPADKFIWGSCEGGIWPRTGWYTALNGQRPDFILIWLGANDEIHKIDKWTTFFNIKEMILLSLEYKMTPIIATLTPDGKYGMSNCEEGELGYFNFALKGLASGKVIVADQCEAIPYWTDNHCGDYLHPNDKGNQTIAETWLGVLPEQSDYYGKISIINGQLLLLLGK